MTESGFLYLVSGWFDLYVIYWLLYPISYEYVHHSLFLAIDHTVWLEAIGTVWQQCHIPLSELTRKWKHYLWSCSIHMSQADGQLHQHQSNSMLWPHTVMTHPVLEQLAKSPPRLPASSWLYLSQAWLQYTNQAVVSSAWPCDGTPKGQIRICPSKFRHLLVRSCVRIASRDRMTWWESPWQWGCMRNEKGQCKRDWHRPSAWACMR